MTQTRPLDIIIVGGGLAGLAAAGYLRERHNVTVLERYPLDFEKNMKGDYGMSIVSNAYSLLKAQGLKDNNLNAVVFTHLWYRDHNNETVQTVAFDTRKTYGAPSILTRRSHLQAELYRFATETSRSGTPARILSGVSIQSLDPLAGVLTTNDGQILRGDLIIGADGINSAVRAAVQAHSSVPRMGADIEVSEGTRAVPTGLIGYITKVPAEVVMADPKMAFQAMNGVGGICRWEGPEGSQLRIICYATEGKRYWQILAYAPEADWIGEFESTGKSILTDIPSDYAVRDFAGFHPSIKRLLGYSPTLDIWRIRDIERMNNWAAGKTVLIGDAAHAITPHVGQGCNIAIEDAEALGFLFRDVALAASASPYEPAKVVKDKIALFQSLRMKRAHFVQHSARHAAGILRGEEKKRSGPFDHGVFAKTVYGYSGCEAAFRAKMSESFSEPHGFGLCML